jgi:stearoyl-CoA desaturase (delta-9 desaturase)
LAIPSFGEALHNSHHRFPRSAWIGLRWWEKVVDFGGMFIELLKLLRLAWNVRVPTAEQIKIALLQTVPE